MLGKKRRFYISITDGTRTKQSSAIRSRGQSVVWNERLDGLCEFLLSNRLRHNTDLVLSVVQGPDMKLVLYAKRHSASDMVIGSIQVKAESNSGMLEVKHTD